jgi:hypothetical protein
VRSTRSNQAGDGLSCTDRPAEHLLRGCGRKVWLFIRGNWKIAVPSYDATLADRRKGELTGGGTCSVAGCRTRRRLAGVGGDGVHEEPRPAVGGGGCPQVPGRAFELQGGAAAAARRALLGRRHAGCAWAPMQNFRAKDGSGQRPAATANVTSMARGAATIRQRPGGKALLQGQRLRGQALLHRQRADPSTALV